jgi:exopolyphosphatase/guanosine-5'-triphosphate,3'-diphosphate pyrophosphatase
LEKIAFIEINNYLAKLIIAETKTNAHFNLITRRIVPIELGKDFEKDHFFKRPQIEDAIEVLKQFKQTCNMFGVEKTNMYGTFLDEMRPKNLNSFIDEVYTKCGFKLDVVDEEQQCEALYKASLGTIDSNKALTCQIEQDSIRIVQYNRRGVVNAKVFSFGPVSLLNTFSKDEYSDEQERIEAIRNYVSHELSSLEWVEDAKQLKFVGVGRYFEGHVL